MLVISSGAIISLLVTHRYSVSLFQGAVAQAKNITHTLAQDAADKILINDLVALQKLLDDQLHSNEFVSYLFIVRDGRILTHTFTNGIPVKLISTNHLIDNNQGHLERIVSNRGERFLDIAWPIFSGKAGILRMGFSETPYRRQVSRLWVQMSAATLGILVFSLFASHLFIKRITQPLLNLTKAVEKVDEGNLNMDVHVKGHDEVGLLTASFNNVLGRIKEYTSRLEEKNLDHKQALKEIQWNYETQTVVNKLLRPSLEDESLEKILHRSLDLILSIPWLAFESKGSIFLVENNSDMLVMKAQSGLPEKIKKRCSRLPFGRCHCGRAAMTKKIQFASCIDESHEILYKGIIPHGHYCVPILYGDI
jgi:two-component system response regulator HydG